MVHAEIQPRILVIDDELGVLKSLRFLMIEYNYDVYTAQTISKGLSIFSDSKPNVVILDLKLRGESGIEGLKKIRELDKTIPVILLTGYGSLETAQEAIRYGANEYLSKPFIPNDLMHLIDQYISRNNQNQPNIDSFKKLKLINNELADEVEQSKYMAELGQLSAEYAHDLSNPLTSTIGCVEFLKKIIIESEAELGNKFNKAEEYINIISRNTKRCYDLSKRWLDYSKRNIFERYPLEIKEVLEDIINEIHIKNRVSLLKDHNIEIISSSEPNIILGDKLQLFRAIFNLVLNAVQALSKKDGTITISCKRIKRQVEIRIVDNGCGIHPKYLHRIFDLYYTSKTSHEFKGTGLGLPITKKIVKEHNGTISVLSELGKGTEFKINLPLYCSED